MPDTTRSRLFEGLSAGVAATLLMTGIFFALPATLLPDEFSRAMSGLTAHPPSLMLALAAHLAYGGLAGALFFGGARRVTIGSSVLFGLGLWGLAAAVYAPLIGLGFVASHRPQLAAIAVPAHVLYGLALAAFAPRGEIVQPLAT